MSKIIFVRKKIQDKINKVKEVSFKKNIFYILISLIVLSIIFFSIKNINKNLSVNTDNNIIEEDLLVEDKCENCFYRLIDAREVFEENDIDQFLIAVVIDNHPSARPAFGLSQAELVYDIPAEGGINRYLAFFAVDDKPDLEIGPVRSARPYFLDIAKEYGAILIHCGGSPEALARISKEKLLSLNEFYNEKYFRRYSAYKAPHNILANFDLIKNYLRDRNYEKSIFDSWKFEKDNDISGVDFINANFEVSISNGQSQYAVKWDYDLNNNLYLKSLDNKKHLDNDGRQISVSNLILHFVDTQILDKELRLKINLIGENKAIICINGLCQEGYWQKENENSRTKYYYENGEEVIFNPGQTWIHFIDKNTKTSY